MGLSLQKGKRTYYARRFFVAKMSANVKTDPSDAHQGNSMATAAAIASLSGGCGNVSTVEVKDVKLEAAAVPKVERQPALPTEDEPEYDDSLVILDWCKCVI